MSEHTDTYDYDSDQGYRPQHAGEAEEEHGKERRFSPGRVVDGILEYTRSHPGGWTAGMGETMRRNALPIAMISAGVLWMVAEGSMKREPVRRRVDSARNAARDVMDRTVEKARHAVDDGSETAGGLVRTAAERVKEGTREAAGAASRYGRRVTSTASRTGQNAWRAVERTYDENPLALGVLVALGAAAVALSIPSSRQEDELMGEVRDEVATKARRYVKGAREAGKAAVNAAKSELKGAAKAAADAAKDEAKAQGIIAEDKTPKGQGSGSAKSGSGSSGSTSGNGGSASTRKENPGL